MGLPEIVKSADTFSWHLKGMDIRLSVLLFNNEYLGKIDRKKGVVNYLDSRGGAGIQKSEMEPSLSIINNIIGYL